MKEYIERYRQKELQYAFEAAQFRIKSNSEYIKTRIALIENQPHFKTEKDALEAAIKLRKNKDAIKDYCTIRIFAKVEQDEEYYRIADYWIVTEDGPVVPAAELAGLVMVYENQMIQDIVDGFISMNDALNKQ